MWLIQGAASQQAGPAGFETESQAYFDALSGAGYPLSGADQTWVDNRVKNLKGMAAGDIDIATAYNCWDNIKLLVLGKHNAGAGNTVYAIKGGNATGSAVSWIANGFYEDGLQFNLTSGMEVGAGVHNGVGMFLDCVIKEISLFQDIVNDNLLKEIEIQNTNQLWHSFFWSGTSPTATYELGYVAIDDRMEMVLRGIDQNNTDGEIFRRATWKNGAIYRTWDYDGHGFGLPDASNTMTWLGIGNLSTEMSTMMVVEQNIGDSSWDNIRTIFNAVN